MAGELQIDWMTGRTVYFLVRSATAQVWNGSALENYLTANYASYRIAGVEQGTASGFYTGTMPALAAGIYSITAREQGGALAAETDQTVGVGTLSWTGTAVAAILNALNVTGTVAANVLKVNNVAIQGLGTSSQPWGPA